ncbi:cob(I)yrinic acid a,c-diamide adenosyltransferase [Intestinimonas massiliensis (ex Afouda et al. 2020)]|uniref:cob(I)yrinic acid a,c-diamide adenosyltransferase n=1 Tax=Intestinimonas massiliensis (ex Afouda et al. 2020) TaxID=1673721 RepID=UPI0010307AFB|nr:cob(I)yrinic acid a,c-diamide adenosyltransferase [Intestinimonas massiliensis (ex Afouda et al. 2020)]
MADQQGLVQIYYGDGKGKTTAAFGLAFRCAGWGRNVVIAQFLKSGAGGEVKAAERFPELTVLRTKDIHKFTFQMNDEEKAATAVNCQELFRQATALAAEQQARLLVLDEAIDATYGFLPMDELCAWLDSRPEGLEVVITGHSIPQELADRADYISHVVKEKHPYDRGVMARKEIEF